MCGLVRTPTSYIGVKLPGVLIPGFTLNKMALFSKFLIFFTRNVVRGALRRCAHTESGKCLVNNVNLHYEKVGNSSQVLLCLPGAMGSTHTDFAPQLDGLKYVLIQEDMGNLYHQKETFPWIFITEMLTMLLNWWKNLVKFWLIKQPSMYLYPLFKTKRLNHMWDLNYIS